MSDFIDLVFEAHFLLEILISMRKIENYNNIPY